MKKFLQKIHLIVGLISGIVIFIVATTGCITAFDEELRNYFYSDLFEVKNAGSTQKNLDELIELAKKENPEEKIKGLRVKLDPTQSVEIQFQNKTSVFIDPYSGKILGSLNRDQDFFGKVLKIHRNLYLEEKGEWITGISALLFLSMIVSGIVIWWPTNKKNRREKFTLKKNVHWKKRNYDLHSVLGFYASWFILLTVLTGLIWSWEWAEDGMYWLTNSKQEKRMEINSVAEKTETPTPLDQIYQNSLKLYPEQKESILTIPKEEEGTIRVTARYENNGFFRRQDNLFYDQYDGKLVKNKPFSSMSAGSKFKMSNLNFHTGRSFGIVGQWAVFFASLICASLPITGFLIWWNKRKVKTD